MKKDETRQSNGFLATKISICRIQRDYYSLGHFDLFELGTRDHLTVTVRFGAHCPQSHPSCE
jgi:hypothetical protein